VTGTVLTFPHRPLSTDAGVKAAERVLATPFDERLAKARSLHLEDPETLLALCGILRDRVTSSPSAIRDRPSFFIASLKRRSEPSASSTSGSIFWARRR
jgi:hypothetical protein